ncbi:MAG: formylglycine-generating enzyme family protein [Nitrospirae bacterium YQR-1]
MSAADYTCPITGMEFVFVKGGCYQMGDMFGEGDKDEKPLHEVCLDSFYIGKYPVTQGQWTKVTGSNASASLSGDEYPVECVSWYEAMEFINKLNTTAGVRYRLTTEAEWEYACRGGGKKEKWAGISDITELGEYAWYDGNSGMIPHPVGRKKPNSLGLYDMSGNVWEWVEDVYDEAAYKKHSLSNPVNTGSEGNRVMRGGSWRTPQQFLRCSYRSHNSPDFRDFHIGFRLVYENNLLDFLLINV